MVLEILQYSFMQKALVTSIAISIACSILGVFLILKKYSLIGDGLAHISFGGIALGMFARVSPYITALLFGVIGALGIMKLKEKARLFGDTAIGIVSYASLGFGIFLASLAQGFNVNILSYLFGNILAISTSEMIVSIALAILVIILIFLFYSDLFALSFDEESARTSGVKVNFLNSMLIIMTAVTIVASMRVVGLLLASAMILLPAASAFQISKSFKGTIIISAVIAIISVIAGLFLSYTFDFATSGTIVLLNFLIFILFFSFKRIKERSTAA